jgi:hypothetical protein
MPIFPSNSAPFGITITILDSSVVLGTLPSSMFKVLANVPECVVTFVLLLWVATYPAKQRTGCWFVHKGGIDRFACVARLGPSTQSSPIGVTSSRRISLTQSRQDLETRSGLSAHGQLVGFSRCERALPCRARSRCCW